MEELKTKDKESEKAVAMEGELSSAVPTYRALPIQLIELAPQHTLLWAISASE